MTTTQDRVREWKARQMVDQYNHHPLLNEKQVEEYANSLNRHIINVTEAGKTIGVPQEQLVIHDQSKWSEEEFPYYARKFFGGEAPINAERIPNDFAAAWLHHMNHNQHHWQYWIFPDGFTPKGSDVEAGVIEMPRRFALEMVADWMGSSKTYTGSWDMQSWLWENMPHIRVHSRTAEYLREVLDVLGYADTIYVQRWAQELEKEA